MYLMFHVKKNWIILYFLPGYYFVGFILSFGVFFNIFIGV